VAFYGREHKGFFWGAGNRIISHNLNASYVGVFVKIIEESIQVMVYMQKIFKI
jgi:hypothetical protein